MGQRLEWIDICKGLGIILVVLGHAKISKELADYIFSFHVPLFFFISGYLLVMERYDGVINFTERKVKTILIPYFCFAALSVIAQDLITGLPVFRDTHRMLDLIFISKRNTLLFNNPLWFLTCLFSVEVVFFALKRLIKNDVILYFVLFASGAVGFIYFETIKLPKFPWTFDATLYYLFFYGLGYFIRQHKTALPPLLNRFLLLAAIVLNITRFYSPVLFWQVLSFKGTIIYSPYIFSIITAITGIGAYFALSMAIGRFPPIGFLGRNSLIVLSLHILIFTWLDTVLPPLNLPANSNMPGLIYTVLSLIIVVPLIYIINRYLPLLKGKLA